MSEVDLHHIHEDLVTLKEDIALIKHMLIEEGELTPEAMKRLETMRKTPLSEYKEL